ncbi:hypothetical protein PR202_ga25122 [Eleusine coracana subsp. coracana]|uniref:DUF659 domain-containing protein n=1 Tax=Eleusine coracana subsp. coracana TaxID=191504 RepID=A0AAV5DB34_ELECO|nr:hypothetical protein PR202_ga25122 [Eleusine coracana subsp. coracana]
MGGYVPPGVNKLRTTLLQQEEKQNVEKLLEPLKKIWGAKGVTIASDGWSDAQRRPLINFIAVTENGPMFLKCENNEGKVKSKEYIADLLIQVIETIGPKNVVQVIIDNAANCKAAGLIVEAKYSNIFWSPCVVHTLNLALKNICAPKNNENQNMELQFISDAAGDALQIKNYIMNHGMRLSMFNEFSKLKFLAIADTRFASVIVMLKRFLLLKNSLVRMVTSDKWSAYKEDDQQKARFVRDKLLDEDWWYQVKYIIEFTAPIYSMLRAADTDKACLHLIYEMWDSMIEKPSTSSTFDDRLFVIVRYYCQQWLSEVPGRIPPHEDGEISEERNAYFKKFFPIADDLRKIKKQFADYSLNRGVFATPDMIEDRAHFDPLQWWGTYGARTPELKELAFKLLGQPASSSCCERNWSTYGFIHSLRRNKLTPEHAEDLIYVHNNLRLLLRCTDDYLTGPSKMWDVGADEHETFDGISVLQGAELTLDEPEFEVMMIEDEAASAE